MTDQGKTIPANRVMKRTVIGSFLLTAIALLARAAGVLPMPQDMSPPVAIAFCATTSGALLLLTNWYLKRTDEHDLHANLWSMTWAWVAAALITIDWEILYAAGLVGAPKAMQIILASAAVAAFSWAWLRFR